MPRVSVIVPVYNVENFLKECLNSILAQTFYDIEIICVNDGSTDNSLEILQSYASKDNRINIINQKNGGLSSARNTGLSVAKGEFICFLDSDDYIESTLIEKNVQIMDEFDVDFVNFEAEVFGFSNEKLQKYLKNKYKGLVDFNYNKARKTNIHVWNKFYKKSLIDKWNLKFIEGLLYEDIFFNWIYFLRSKRAYYLSETLYQYRIRSSSIMVQSEEQKDFQKALHHLYNIEGLLNYFANDDEFWRKNKKYFLRILRVYYKRTLELSPSDKLDDVTEVYKNLYEKFVNIFVKKYNLLPISSIVKLLFVLKFKMY